MLWIWVSTTAIPVLSGNILKSTVEARTSSVTVMTVTVTLGHWGFSGKCNNSPRTGMAKCPRLRRTGNEAISCQNIFRALPHSMCTATIQQIPTMLELSVRPSPFPFIKMCFSWLKTSRWGESWWIWYHLVPSWKEVMAVKASGCCLAPKDTTHKVQANQEWEQDFQIFSLQNLYFPLAALAEWFSMMFLPDSFQLLRFGRQKKEALSFSACPGLSRGVALSKKKSHSCRRVTSTWIERSLRILKNCKWPNIWIHLVSRNILRLYPPWRVLWLWPQTRYVNFEVHSGKTALFHHHLPGIYHNLLMVIIQVSW